MGQGFELQHRTIRRLDHQFIRRYHLNSTETHQDFCFSTGWTDAWMEGTIGSSDGLIQIQHNRPKCGAFSTRWSDGASVYSVGVLYGFQGSPTILACISDQMIRRSARGNHRFIRRYYFSGDYFQGLASNARPINKPPTSLELTFAILKIHCCQGEKESVFLPFGILFLLIEVFFLVIKSVQGAYMAWGQVMVCGLVTLGVWRLLDGLGDWGFLVSSWRLWEPQDKLGGHGSRPTIPEMENGYS
jgi:hypothetical protein